MKKMWAGVTDGITNSVADGFNSSISFDKRLYTEDILGSIAHAEMLVKAGIITEKEGDEIIHGLTYVFSEMENDENYIDSNAEDIHMFIEQKLTDYIGDVGKKLHTARSRNDQVALDMKMYVRKEISEIKEGLLSLIKAVSKKAEEYKKTVMPGYTHLQRAQPVTFGHQLLAYVMMLMRDIDRLNDCTKRLNVCPIGSCALAGTTYNTDRKFEAEKLGFDSVTLNSIDGVSDRDYLVELLSDISLIMAHLSRFSEEIILWSSWEFKFIELSNGFTTGSSIMPQKKNPDMAELVRGKSGRVFGDLIGMLTVLKGLPLAYNKDLQEDKEAVFDAIDTVKACINIFVPMIKTMKAIPENMKKAAEKGFINATDLADYLVKKGIPFRTAYKIAGETVSKCISENKTLDTLEIEEYKKICNDFDNDLYEEISIENCVKKRISEGGTGFDSVQKQLNYVKNYLKMNKK